MIQQFLRFLRELEDQIHSAPNGEYNRGCVDTIENVLEVFTDLMWEEGIDEEDA